MLERLSLKSAVIVACLVLAPLFAVGWATREDPAETPLLGVAGGGFVFNYREGEVFYGFTAMVQKGNVMGVQFHPEKSHRFGMKVLHNFARF